MGQKIWVEGHESVDADSNIAPDYTFPPFRIFDPAAQDYLKAVFPDRLTAEIACAILAQHWPDIPA